MMKKVVDWVKSNKKVVMMVGCVVMGMVVGWHVGHEHHLHNHDVSEHTSHHH